MDVRDDGEDAPPHDLGERLAGPLVGNRYARDLAADLLELFDLPDRRVDVVREGRAHRLDGHRSAVADRGAADPNALGLAPRTGRRTVFREVEIDGERGVHQRQV